MLYLFFFSSSCCLALHLYLTHSLLQVVVVAPLQSKLCLTSYSLKLLQSNVPLTFQSQANPGKVFPATTQPISTSHLLHNEYWTDARAHEERQGGVVYPRDRADPHEYTRSPPAVQRHPPSLGLAACVTARALPPWLSFVVHYRPGLIYDMISYRGTKPFKCAGQPCIGRLWFLGFNLRHHPSYSQLLACLWHG